MSGHSKWSSIKHQKGVADAKRGQVFTKLAREIIVLVRQGGPSPDANFKLRLAIQKARDVNMPMDNIERAIKRGSGETDGAALAEMVIEGYGPGGAAIFVQALSDNRNRTSQEVRNIFNRGGGNMATPGSVTWLFDSKGLIVVDTNNLDKDDVSLKAIDAGADDVNTDEHTIEIQTKPETLEAVRTALEQAKIPIASAELLMVPKTTVNLGEKEALQVLRLLNRLEELDEVQSVSSNVNFSDDILQKYQEQA